MLRACLAVVLLTCAVSPVLAQNGRGDVSAPGTADATNRTAGASATTAPEKPAASSGYVRPSTPATSQGGGGDEDAVIRMRVPKWNSFLPGMFR
ncbi:hypothetical protein [Pseudoxanthomonas sp.]|uniref:hypothetical protein n=1 Tax=Pseudoxanthomonas sp. TaxID=1871049 RepID=UPI00262A11FA|nr:hypothetical protein [Pseudoxanthomonas sp.]WDS35562.1 MAG: hypothetical protein O8I58_14650 [Pseudoxanthomonas sp.]